MKKIDLSAAFDSGRMFEEGIDNGNITMFLAKNAKTFAPIFMLLRKGCGIAFIDNGDEVTVIGVEEQA